ncbi:MAG: HNH endonuclease [Bacteroidetes bacterium]|nr:MAG: HNH endonuclease [Bacteroidota bacterium]
MAFCELCEREVGRTSRHHLLPKQKGGKHTKTVDLCQPCHSTIHHTFTNTELARQYTTVEALRDSEQMQVYLEWIRKRRVERL